MGPVNNSSRLPLQGLLVADFSRVLAGPLTSMILGDLGAEVVKVEHPKGGDDTRDWGPPYARDGQATYFLSVNRNKKSVTLDFNDELDRQTAVRLANHADVVVENFRPGRLARYGLDYDSIAGRNPRVVYASLTSFGSHEHAAHLAGYDLIVQAVSGFMAITGETDGAPTKVGVAVVDVMAGLYLAIGVLTALRRRDVTGLGDHIEVSLFDAALSGLVNQAAAVVEGGTVPSRLGNAHPSIVPYQAFMAKDEMFVVAAANDGMFARLCDVVGKSFHNDQRFATNELRVENRISLIELLSDEFAKMPADYWIERFVEVGVPSGPINEIDAALTFAEKIGADPLMSHTRANGSTIATVRSPLRFDSLPDGLANAAPPLLGEQNDSLRAWLDQLGS